MTTPRPTGLPPLRTLFFDNLKVGMSERLKKTIAASDVVGFAQLTGDRNPIHLSGGSIQTFASHFGAACANV